MISKPIYAIESLKPEPLGYKLPIEAFGGHYIQNIIM